VPAIHADLSSECSLGEITGDPTAHMEYKNYHRDIVMKHQVQLINFTHTKLQSPGSMGTSLPVFVKLLEALESGHCHFEKLTPKEVEHLDEVHLAELAASGEVMPVRKIRSDAGKPKGKKKRRQITDSSESSGSEDDEPPVKKKRMSASRISGPSAKSKDVLSDTE
jgi:hypothetical protein